MEIYGLTTRGHLLARSTHSPPTPEWRVIHFLDKAHQSTKEQISEYCGLSPVQTAVVMRKLKSRRIVATEVGANV